MISRQPGIDLTSKIRQITLLNIAYSPFFNERSSDRPLSVGINKPLTVFNISQVGLDCICANPLLSPKTAPGPNRTEPLGELISISPWVMTNPCPRSK